MDGFDETAIPGGAPLGWLPRTLHIDMQQQDGSAVGRAVEAVFHWLLEPENEVYEALVMGTHACMLQTMRKWPAVRLVQYYGTLVLRLMAESHEPCGQAIVDLGGPYVIAATRDRFPNDGQLQGACASLLLNLAHYHQQ